MLILFEFWVRLFLAFPFSDHAKGAGREISPQLCRILENANVFLKLSAAFHPPLESQEIPNALSF
jgi:hypothetical protein